MADTTDPQFPPRDRLFALIASIPGSGAFDWCTPARALLDEIEASAPSAPADRSGLLDAAAQAIRDSNGSPEALEWWRTHPQLIPAHVYAAAVLSVLPSANDRAASYRLAADAIESMQGYPHLILPEEIVAALRLLAAGEQPEPGSPAYTRRLADEERDERQTQQDGAETRDALMAAHAALAEQAGRDQAALARVERLALAFEVSGNEFIAGQIRAAVGAQTRGPWGTVPGCNCPHPADEHSIYGCADGCGCEWMPRRKPMDPVHILGIEAAAPTTPAAVVAEPGKENSRG